MNRLICFFIFAEFILINANQSFGSMPAPLPFQTPMPTIPGLFSQPQTPVKSIISEIQSQFMKPIELAPKLTKQSPPPPTPPLAPPSLPPSPPPPSSPLADEPQKLPKFCAFTKPINCDPTYPYRTFDGTCNNLRNLWWGKAEAPYKRIIQAAYADGLNEPRVSRDGSELPNAREMSCLLHAEKYEIEPNVNHAFMQWGQFINHDITSLSISRDEEKSLGICSKCKKTIKCLPIHIRSNMTCNCIQQMSHQCIEFTRSSIAFGDIQCQNPVREQINLQTTYIDGSMVYAISDEFNSELRDKTTGKGRMLVQPGVNLLPRDMSEKPSDCLDFSETKRCFKAGDDRVNQNTALMTYHTLFVREHNRIADILANLNPTWTDETVFQEARRVVIAQIQHITYNEYIPTLLGRNNAALYNLLPGLNSEQKITYNPDIDPRIANEYAASFGRFGHSMVRSTYSRVNNKYQASGHSAFMLRHGYFRSNHIYDVSSGGLESIVRGMVKDPVMKIDRWFTEELTKHLFETNDDLGRPIHFDLISINIQRGRDHGVPGYTKFRELCGLPPVRSWDEMKQYVFEDSVDMFRSFYKFFEDVDLFSAIVAERKQDDSLVGPTLVCLLANQFRDLKFGDRFWYENSQYPASFTPAQLAEIRKTSLAKVLCRNLFDTPEIQPQAMLSSKLNNNSLKSCNELFDINWNLWKV